jgi:GNAT superfamily N-acetyltransferase
MRMQADPDGASAAARQPPVLLEEIAAESRRRRELVRVVRRLSEQAGETPAIGAMRDAVNASLPGDWIVLAWEGEALVGALAYRPTDIGGGTLVSYVGSRKRGVGRRLVRVAARSAAGRGAGLRAAAIPLASGFWERLGFRRVRKGGTLLPVFVLDARRTAAFAAGGEDEPAAQA